MLTNLYYLYTLTTSGKLEKIRIKKKIKRFNTLSLHCKAYFQKDYFFSII